MTDISGNEPSLEKTRLDRDLGLNVSVVLKWIGNVNRMEAKANRILCMLKRTFESRDPGRSLCSSSKATLRVRCASLDSSLPRRH